MDGAGTQELEQGLGRPIHTTTCRKAQNHPKMGPEKSKTGSGRSWPLGACIPLSMPFPKDAKHLKSHSSISVTGLHLSCYLSLVVWGQSQAEVGLGRIPVDSSASAAPTALLLLAPPSHCLYPALPRCFQPGSAFLPCSLLPYRGQALQVQLLRAQLQAAEHAGGAQGALPQLPAEPARGAAGPGQPGRSVGHGGADGDRHSQWRRGSCLWRGSPGARHARGLGDCHKALPVAPRCFLPVPAAECQSFPDGKLPIEWKPPLCSLYRGQPQWAMGTEWLGSTFWCSWEPASSPLVLAMPEPSCSSLTLPGIPAGWAERHQE